ncbi:hypothetical protein KKP91_03705 [Methanothermococcus sp. SCGC AD-155-M21]|nr:hypothetical protein [Methanothermococcus sp. SCGC AD-155-M21]
MHEVPLRKLKLLNCVPYELSFGGNSYEFKKRYVCQTFGAPWVSNCCEYINGNYIDLCFYKRATFGRLWIMGSDKCFIGTDTWINMFRLTIHTG